MSEVLSSSPGSEGEFLFYTAPDGSMKVEVFCHDETVWLTQKALAALFGVQVPAIAKHLKNIFESGELQEDSVVSILETTAADAKNYQTRYYNLDAIIAVGYRVNSFLELSDYPVLQDKSKVSALEAKLKAESEYEIFRTRQDAEYISDFDREIKRLEGDQGEMPGTRRKKK